MILIKLLCAFFVLLFSTNQSWLSVERDRLNYEITNVTLEKDFLTITGWGIIPDTQHFKGDHTHSYYLELTSNNDQIQTKGSLTDVNLTDHMEYKGYRKCSPFSINKQSCNYEFKNVGFKFEIPTNKLRVGEEYSLFLKMNAKQASKFYKIPLFIIQDNEIILKDGRKQYTLLSSYKHTRFQVYAHTLYSRTNPTPHSPALRTGDNCSLEHQNTAYFKQQAVFNEILSIKTYRDLITYFHVNVEPSGCVNKRQRLIESKSSQTKAYIPSTHVNYLGKPTTLKVHEISSIPNLIIEDITLYQNEPYNALNQASAFDIYDLDLTNSINVTSSNVDTALPGTYRTCYLVKNTQNNLAEGCGRVTVLKKPTKKRYVSKYSIHNTELRLWNRTILREFLLKK